MLKKAAVFSMTLVMVVAIAGPARAITFGQPDTNNNYPYVGTILFQRPTGYFSCSGTLLSPTVMITAGHCTAEAGVVNLHTWVNFDQTIDLSNRTNYPSLQDYLNAEWISATAYPHPQYDDFSQFPNTYDVGVVVLDEPVTLSEYGELAGIGFLETITSKNNTFTAVGYGMQGYIKPFESDIWARYYGTVRLIELKSTSTGDQASAKFTNNPGKGGGTCFGDSGGPIFHNGTNRIVAVVSWGITPCIGVDYQFRVDTAIAQDFVNPFLP